MVQDLPKYMTLVNWIRNKVESEELRCGDRLYSENELSAMFGISRQTVRQAVGILEQEHVVERRRGSGTYIVYSPHRQRAATKNIGVITTYLDDYIFTSIIRGIETVLAENGYTMQIAFTHNHVENETRALRTMLEKGVDGIIAEPTKSGLPNLNLPLYEELRRREIPVVFFNAYYPALDFPHVAMDDRAAGRIVTNCLIEAGHRRIGGIFQLDDLQGHLRYAGYAGALAKAGLELCDENVIWYATEDRGDLSANFQRILKRLRDCTGLVCYNDQIAFTVIEQLRKNGVSVPEQLSVVGIDNSEISSLCEVPFTSVSHPKELLGKTVAENLLRLIGGDTRFHATVDFVPELVERESVRRLL